MKFYTNLYPIKYGLTGHAEDNLDIPTGTVFKIDAINCNGFDLKTISDIGANPITVTCEMLKVGFTESDYIK